MSDTTVDMREETGPFSVAAISGGFQINGPEFQLQLTQAQVDDIAGDLAALVPPVTSGPKKIVFIGDSVTLGVRPGVVSTDTFAHKVGTARGFDVIVNKGVGGENSAEMLARFHTAVIAENPHAVCIMAGINDYYDGLGVAAYEANLVAMVNLAKAAGIESITVCSPNLVRDSVMIAAFQPWLNALTRVGEIEGVALIDVYKDWVWGHFTLASGVFDALFVPGESPFTHPSATGHTRIHNLILVNPNGCRKP